MPRRAHEFDALGLMPSARARHAQARLSVIYSIAMPRFVTNAIDGRHEVDIVDRRRCARSPRRRYYADVYHATAQLLAAHTRAAGIQRWSFSARIRAWRSPTMASRKISSHRATTFLDGTMPAGHIDHADSKS